MFARTEIGNSIIRLPLKVGMHRDAQLANVAGIVRIRYSGLSARTRITFAKSERNLQSRAGECNDPVWIASVRYYRGFSANPGKKIRFFLTVQFKQDAGDEIPGPAGFVDADRGFAHWRVRSCDRNFNNGFPSLKRE